MSYEMTVGLFVVDHQKYAVYRAASAPLLEASGAKFRYDFEVARTLKTEAGHEINRIFILQFPDRVTRERFFSNPDYLEIRARFFEKSVEGMTIIGEYTT